ncbi:hypothetical protein BN59_01417 [Legionella massiliensis]|uniref:Uncharacterized protein n=1 Tax=Legionella massiliensis TaxID=1034943 RepID=A0A078KRS6_9GAMM|nr:hypothetical protein [Legionella massiliensis]CDZ77135.1 hypothetical protein BN59_01417 [Legionella massiliensis]CEE12873.1 hypothetical protein BN1094_01417 [Legionella massiliensis]
MSSSPQHVLGLFAHDLSIDQLIKIYCKEHYPNLVLDADMLEQLLWLQTNSVITSQSDGKAKPDAINPEVKRILARLNCLYLLRSEEEPALRWQEFVKSQEEGIKLTQESFNFLSSFIGSLSKSDYQCLIASCFITKSDKAEESIPSALKEGLPFDSEQFISYMVEKCPEILPICRQMGQPERELLCFAFYKNCHARHILDMEGGHNMLFALKEGIKTQAIDQDKLNLWFGRWILNIAGIDGHIEPAGSSFLTEPIAGSIFALKRELDQLLTNIDHPVIENYLAYRVSKLEVSNNYLAALGALMRKNTPDVGAQIQSWFNGLSFDEQQEKLKSFEKQLTITKVTPTFKPTVLLNLLGMKYPVDEAVDMFSKIEIAALDAWTEAMSAGIVTETTPLSFRTIAYGNDLSKVIEQIQQGSLHFEMNAKGCLALAPPKSLILQFS